MFSKRLFIAIQGESTFINIKLVQHHQLTVQNKWRYIITQERMMICRGGRGEKVKVIDKSVVGGGGWGSIRLGNVVCVELTARIKITIMFLGIWSDDKAVEPKLNNQWLVCCGCGCGGTGKNQIAEHAHERHDMTGWLFYGSLLP